LTGISRFSARRPEQKNVILGWFSGCAFWTALFFKTNQRPVFGTNVLGSRLPRYGTSMSLSTALQRRGMWHVTRIDRRHQSRNNVRLIALCRAPGRIPLQH
jgi:hypothetical protein